MIEVPQEQELTPEILENWTRLPERILFHSGQPDHWETFPEIFSYLAPALVHTLADRGGEADRDRLSQRGRFLEQVPAHPPGLRKAGPYHYRGPQAKRGPGWAVIVSCVCHLICPRRTPRQSEPSSNPCEARSLPPATRYLSRRQLTRPPHPRRPRPPSNGASASGSTGQ